MSFSLKTKILFFIAEYPGALLLYILMKTLSVEIKGLDFYEKVKDKPLIYAFWHGRLLLGVYYFRKKNIKVLVSQNKDGEIIARIIHKFGFGTIRGSSSKDAVQSLIQTIRSYKGGQSVGITPDGPRGPKFKIQGGVVKTAYKTKGVIIPFSYSAKNKWVLKSWDSFIIPKPFSKAVMVFAEPIFAQGLNEEEIEKKLQESLDKTTDYADSYFSL